MKITVLDGQVLNPGDVSWEPLRELGELAVHEFTAPKDFASRVTGSDMVLVNKTLVREHNIPSLSSCRLVGVLATGANNLDLPALARAGIPVCNTPSYGVEDVAQHALALLMELARGTRKHTQSVLSGDWARNGWCYWLTPPLSLAGLTLGIIGFGAIGQAMGRIGHSLGMNVLAITRNSRPRLDYPYKSVSLPDLLAESDVISLHCPLTPETDKIINEKTLAVMKSGAILLNTARGGLVDEAAAAEALKRGKLGALGTDVCSIEPPEPDNPLLHAPNVLITPHMAWATARARQNIIDIMAQNIASFLQGKPQNIIN